MTKTVPISDFEKFSLQSNSRWILDRMDQETLLFLEGLKRNLWKNGLKKDKLPICKEKNGRVQIIDGHLRIVAMRELSQEINKLGESKFPLPMQDGEPCLLENQHFLIREVSDEEAERLWVISMIQRKSLSIAQWFELMDEFIDGRGYSIRDFADYIDKSKSLINVYDKVRKSKFRRKVEKGQMSLREAYEKVRTPREKKPEEEEPISELPSDLGVDPYPHYFYVSSDMSLEELQQKLTELEPNARIELHQEPDKYQVFYEDPAIREPFRAWVHSQKTAFDSSDLEDEGFTDYGPPSQMATAFEALEEDPLTREEVFPSTTRELRAREEEELLKKAGSLSRELLTEDAQQDFTLPLTKEQFTAYFNSRERRKVLHSHQFITDNRVVCLFKNYSPKLSCIQFLLKHREDYPLTREQLERFTTLLPEEIEALVTEASLPLPEKDFSERCRFFGFKMDAPEGKCSNCSEELLEPCTSKTKKNIKNGNIPPNADKSLEEIGYDLAALLLSSGRSEPDAWKRALLKFAKESRASIKSVSLNDAHRSDLQKELERCIKEGSKEAKDLHQHCQNDEQFQAYQRKLHSILKTLREASLRVRLPIQLSKDLEDCTLDEDVLVLRECPKCPLLGSDRCVWRWMPFGAAECSREHIVDMKKSKAALRDDYVREQVKREQEEAEGSE